MDKQKDGQTDGWTNGRIDKRMDGLTDKKTNGQMDRQLEVRMEGTTDMGQVDEEGTHRQMEGQMVKQVGEQVDAQVYIRSDVWEGTETDRWTGG